MTIMTSKGNGKGKKRLAKGKGMDVIQYFEPGFMDCYAFQPSQGGGGDLAQLAATWQRLKGGGKSGKVCGNDGKQGGADGKDGTQGGADGKEGGKNGED